MKKYHLVVFGCQMNVADAERIATVLDNLGYKKTSVITEADLIVVVACSVRQSAVDRIHGLTNKFNEFKAKTVLTGCVLETDRKKFEKHFDYILDINTLNDWPKIIKGKSKNYPKDYLNISPLRNNDFIAYIPISNGCENFCTYCAVPFTRGPLVSRSATAIIREVKEAVLNGAKEIWLLGQNVNDYQGGGIDFSDLLKRVNNVKGNFWIRFTSPHPKNFSNKLIKTMAECEKFAPYLNLPIQSGSDTVLKRMNRPYTFKQYKKLLDSIREEFTKKRGEDITISTDIIVGFSGETKKEFKESAKAFRECKFDMAYISQYSTRPETFAVLKMKDDVSQKEKKRRDIELTNILKKQISLKNKKYAGRVLKVLILEKKKDYYIGKSWEYKTVRIKSDQDIVGEFVDIQITKVLAWGLEGEIYRPKAIVILGATATRKTDFSIRLAKKVGGEIVSADSRQVYRKMNIGTAKPCKDKGIKEFCVEGIKHHLIDTLNPEEKYNAALFKRDAVSAINKIIAVGKIPIIVGGTGLYISSIVDNLEFPQIKADLKMRRRLEKKSIEELFSIYKKLDKKGADLIDRNNKRRLVRAIEVSMMTGETFFKYRKEESPFDILQIGIKVEKEELEKRINKRVDKMIEDGLEKEMKKLPASSPLMETIGYREWKEYGDKKEIIERIKINTFKFAKRQMTWFKKDKRIHWVEKYSELEKETKKFLKS